MKMNPLIRKFVYFLTVITLFLALTGIVSAQAGTLDPTFGTSGAALTNASSADDEIYAVAIQPDNKIIVAGFSEKPSQFTIARYNTNGTLDTSFGSNGVTKTNFGDPSFIRAIAIQADGKIIAGGVAGNKFALARYTSSGQLDTNSGFGTQGKVTTTIGDTSLINGISIQSDGKIVAAGYRLVDKVADFAVVRYNSNGTLDSSFSGDGIETTDFASGDDRASAVKLQSDGKILLAGSASDEDGFTNFAIVRYNADGSLDTNFNGNGKVLTLTDCAADAMAVQSDGKIVLTGSFDDIYLARYNTNGSLDSGFGTNGIVTTNIGGNSDNAYGLVIDAAGRILVAGSTISGGNEDMVVAKYLSNGNLDTSFDNGDGIVPISLGSNSDIAFSIAIQPNGGIIAGGTKGDFGSKEFATVRLRGVQPTAANVTLSGRVTNSIGTGVSQVRIALTDGQGNISYTITNSFGYYSFANVPVGQTYILNANHKLYTFTPASMVVNLMDEFSEANFVANE